MSSDSHRLPLKSSQFGADTVITGMTRLILMDCFETLVVLVDGVYQPRTGILEFLDHYVVRRNLPVAVISDAKRDLVVTALRQAGIFPRIRDIYDGDTAAESLGAGRIRKRLDLPLKDYVLRPEQVVFIGDSPLDAEAARHHRVPFIRVPRSEDAAFTFVRLISGASRYDSGEFLGNFLSSFPAVDQGRKP